MQNEMNVDLERLKLELELQKIILEQMKIKQETEQLENKLKLLKEETKQLEIKEKTKIEENKLKLLKEETKQLEIKTKQEEIILKEETKLLEIKEETRQLNIQLYLEELKNFERKNKSDKSNFYLNVKNTIEQAEKPFWIEPINCSSSLPSLIPTTINIPSTKEEVQKVLIQTLLNISKNYEKGLTALYTYNKGFLDRKGPDITLLPKQFEVIADLKSTTNICKGLPYISLGFVKVKKPNCKLGESSTLGQILSYNYLLNYVTKKKEVIISALTNYNKIRFIRSEFNENQSVKNFISKEMDLFNVDPEASTDGFCYLYSMMKDGLQYYQGALPESSCHLLDFLGRGASSYVFKILKNNNKLAIKLSNGLNEEWSVDSELYVLKHLKDKVISKNLPEIIDSCEGCVIYKVYDKVQNLSVDSKIQLITLLESVHSLDVFHRDIKPENIMLDNDVPVLIDWNFAITSDVSLGFVGTSNFCAKEYANLWFNKNIIPISYKARYDLESLIKTFYFLENKSIRRRLEQIDEDSSLKEKTLEAQDIWDSVTDTKFRSCLEKIRKGRDIYESLLNYVTNKTDESYLYEMKDSETKQLRACSKTLEDNKPSTKSSYDFYLSIKNTIEQVEKPFWIEEPCRNYSLPIKNIPEVDVQANLVKILSSISKREEASVWALDTYTNNNVINNGKQPDITLIPKKFQIDLTQKNNLEELSLGFLEVKASTSNLTESHLGQLLSYNYLLHSNTKKEIVFSGLTNFRKIRFVRSEFKENVKNFVSKEMDLFNGEASTDGINYLYSMMKDGLKHYQGELPKSSSCCVIDFLGKGDSSCVLKILKDNNELAIKISRGLCYNVYIENEQWILKRLKDKGISNNLPEIMDSCEGCTYFKVYKSVENLSVESKIQLITLLESVHSLGVFHRDVRPENIMLDNDVPILINWSFAIDSPLSFGFAGTKSFCAKGYAVDWLRGVRATKYFARYDVESLLKTIFYIENDYIRKKLQQIKSFEIKVKLQEAQDIWDSVTDTNFRACLEEIRKGENMYESLRNYAKTVQTTLDE